MIMSREILLKSMNAEAIWIWKSVSVDTNLYFGLSSRIIRVGLSQLEMNLESEY